MVTSGDFNWAAEVGDVLMTRHCMEARISLETTAQDGWTPLLTAAYHGQLKIAKMLVNARANLEASSTYGRTPLMCAACGGHAEIVELLKMEGANVMSEDKAGRIALEFARLRGDEHIVEILESKHSPKMSRRLGGAIHAPQLIHAAQRSDKKELQRLLTQKPSQINAVNYLGETALFHATGNVEMMQLLLDFKADVESTNVCGWTPLMFAALHGRAQAASLLLGLEWHQTASFLLGLKRPQAASCSKRGGQHSRSAKMPF